VPSPAPAGGPALGESLGEPVGEGLAGELPDGEADGDVEGEGDSDADGDGDGCAGELWLNPPAKAPVAMRQSRPVSQASPIGSRRCAFGPASTATLPRSAPGDRSTPGSWGLVGVRQAELANRVTLYKALGGGWRQDTTARS